MTNEVSFSLVSWPCVVHVSHLVVVVHVDLFYFSEIVSISIFLSQYSRILKVTL